MNPTIISGEEYYYKWVDRGAGMQRELYTILKEDRSSFYKLSSYFSDIRTYLDTVDDEPFSPIDAHDHLNEQETFGQAPYSSGTVYAVFESLETIGVLEEADSTTFSPEHTTYRLDDYDEAVGDAIEAALDELRDEI
jgi:hypothetical protein